MINPKTQQRELAYVVRIDDIKPIEGKDRVECAAVGGWQVMVQKGLYQPGDLAVYFEIDSKLPETDERFAFLAKYKFRIKTQKFKGFYSQGLLMSAEELGGRREEEFLVINGEKYVKGDFLTQELHVVYYEPEDNKRKAPSADKYKKMAARHPKLFQNPVIKAIYKTNVGKKVLFVFFGKKKDKLTGFPTHFPYVKKTDQERCENIPFVLQDKTPFIVTQKCDGSSGTYILERKHSIFKSTYEFYVCSRNVRQLDENQKCFYEENHYWNVAKKYDIEVKMTDYMNQHPELEYLCWQGEVCSPSIQGNPHGLTEDHLFLFHCIDSQKGKWDIREAAEVWKNYNLEIVPIIDENFILPDDFEEFKQQADGFYDASVCEGKTKQAREGFVYYKTTDPNFSFKNVSRSYLLKHS